MFWESINSKSKQITVLITVLLIFTIYISIGQRSSNAAEPVGYGTNTVKARVTSIVEEGFVLIDESRQDYQVVNVEILEGSFQGQEFTVDYGKKHILSSTRMLDKNMEILVSITELPDGDVFVDFSDFIRMGSLLILTLIFILICILVSGWKGIRSLLGIGISVLIIIYFIIPRILAGDNPIWVSLLGSFVFLTITLYLVYGWTLKTHIALFSIIVAIILTGFISVFFVDFAQLNGMGDESAMYLVYQYDQVNLKNLLIAGIIIGSLGILDDLVLGQTSTVIEMYRANPDMTLKDRFKRSMIVGKDHIAATVNTLVLAYLGASLSLFLVFSNSNAGLGNLINMSYLAEEIVRSLVGTIGLFLAVPMTTFIACWVIDKPDRLSKLVTVFGPLINISDLHH